MCRQIAISITLVMLSACAGPPMQEERGSPTPADCPPTTAVGYYIATVNPPTRSGDWLFEPIRAMELPSLSCGSHQDAIRLVWMDHGSRAIVVLFEQRDREWIVSAFTLRKVYGKPWIVTSQKGRYLTPQELEGIATGVEKSGFWDLASESSAGVDGDSWLVEIRRGRGYHWAWRLTDIDRVSSLGDRLLAFGGIDREKMRADLLPSELVP